jgi:Glycosyl hydrolase family 3 C-terminal domain
MQSRQDDLISAVADVNPNTIVVLNTGSSIKLPWLDEVKAVLDTYYPGQNGAEATARLLFGDVNPSGKLTQTFPTSENQGPVAGDPKAYPGVEPQHAWLGARHRTPFGVGRRFLLGSAAAHDSARTRPLTHSVPRSQRRSPVVRPGNRRQPASAATV